MICNVLNTVPEHPKVEWKRQVGTIVVDSQILVQTDRTEKKISSLYTRYGGYVSGSIVVLMFN